MKVRGAWGKIKEMNFVVAVRCFLCRECVWLRIMFMGNDEYQKILLGKR